MYFVRCITSKLVENKHYFPRLYILLLLERFLSNIIMLKYINMMFFKNLLYRTFIIRPITIIFIQVFFQIIKPIVWNSWSSFYISSSIIYFDLIMNLSASSNKCYCIRLFASKFKRCKCKWMGSVNYSV